MCYTLYIYKKYESLFSFSVLHLSEEGGKSTGAKQTFLVLLVEPEGGDCVLCGAAWMGTEDALGNGGCSEMQPLFPRGRIPELSDRVKDEAMWTERESIFTDWVSEDAVFCL